MSKAYVVRNRESKKARIEESKALNLADLEAGNIVSVSQLTKGLLLIPKLEKVINRFKQGAKAFVAENPDIVVKSGDGKVYSRVPGEKESNVNLKISALIELMQDLAIPKKHIDALEGALRRRGYGQKKATVTYRWVNG